MTDFTLATAAHAQYVGENLRQSDREELALAWGIDPAAAVVESVGRSTIAWAALDGDEPLAVFGVGPYPGHPGVGIVWLLATDRVADYARDFLVRGRYYVGLMSRLYPRLINAVYAGNARSRRWLRHLGFRETSELFEHGVGKAPFVLIEYNRNV